MSIKRLHPTIASVTPCADAQAAPATLAGEANVVLEKIMAKGQRFLGRDIVQLQSNRVLTWKLLIEVFLIILGVLLGLFFNEIRLQQKNHDRAQVALLQINSELQYNRGQVADIASHHSVVRDSLSVLLSRLDTLERPISLQKIISAVPGGFGFVRLQKHAWGLAVELGTLENMDYRIATELSRVYNLQELYLVSYSYLSENFFVASNLSPDSREGLAMGLYLLAQNITHLEKDLLATYDAVLEQTEVTRKVR